MPVGLQVLVGASTAAAFVGLLLACTLAGMVVPLMGWVLIFFGFWIACFLAIRKRLYSMLSNFILTVLALWMTTTAMGYHI